MPLRVSECLYSESSKELTGSDLGKECFLKVSLVSMQKWDRAAKNDRAIAKVHMRGREGLDYIVSQRLNKCKRWLQ